MSWTDVLSGFSDFMKNNGSALQGIGSIIGGVGDAYGKYKQNQALENNYKLNLDLLRKEQERRKKADEGVALGWENSSYAKGA